MGHNCPGCLLGFLSEYVQLVSLLFPLEVMAYEHFYDIMQSFTNPLFH